MDTELTKQWSSDLKPQPGLGIFGLLRESFKTLKRNRKLMLPLLLHVFLFFSLLEFAQIYLLEPVGKDLASQLAEHPKLFEDFGNNMHRTDYRGALNDIREILLVKLFIFIFSSIISLVFFVATVSSSYEAYTAKAQDLTEMIMKIKKSWKKPIGISFYMILFTMGFIFGCFFYIGMVSILAGNSWASYMFYGVVFLSIVVLWIYGSALWMMSLVVSVLEDAGGLDAIFKARELMKGENVKASLLMVLYGVASSVVYWVTHAIISQTPEKWSEMVISVVLTTGLICALKLFMFVVFTIFYHEQKEVCDEKAAKSLYLPIAGDEV
ncbi:hypothetical protein HanRHA438_Chr06g0271811 [Helianthus annuus]|uniref:Transmembrane protein n=1 Tax=Helianthus annuus TaxID=4232 RepID=A0A251UIF9_HELAN|nr:uncharacterized protein LOC110944335 [Helianthus annuus]KAJ0567220.1 hypothetical protein HanIR_Chr06g0282321 [Helianthus annuus]KAJ0912218.1 hypothetical protein HanRHA438_Chr06g0271811 [Helianthus annuus]